MAERLLQRLIQEVNANPTKATPISVKMWGALIQVYASLTVDAKTAATTSNSKKQAVAADYQYPFEKANAVLSKMVKLHQEHPQIHPAPTEHHYSTVLYACCNWSVVADSAVTMAEALMQSLEAGQTPVQPTVDMYNNVILAHANRAGTVYGAAAAAEDWLLRLSKLSADEGSNGGVQPDTRSFNRVLKAWSNSPEDQGASRAAEILHLMLELTNGYNIKHRKRIQPDAVSFGTVITAFAKRRQPEASELILEEAVAYFTNKHGGSGVDLTQCWNSACFAWAQSGVPDAPERTEALLEEAVRAGNNEQIFVRPDTATYAACIEAHLSSARPNRVEKAEGHLRAMVNALPSQSPTRLQLQTKCLAAIPTIKEFDTVIHAWYRCQTEYEGDGIHSNGGRRPFGYAATHATNLLLTALELTERQFAMCAPATGTFNMCIDTWCNTSKACVAAALQLRRASKNNAAPNAVAVDAASRSHEQTMRDQAVSTVLKAVELLAMAEVRVLSNDFSYSTVIHALCRVENADCSVQAARTLERLEREVDERDLSWPSTAVHLYTTVVSALGKVGSADAAELALKLLRGIPQDGKRAIHDKIKIYTGVLSAFSKLPGQRSGIVAAELFVELLALDKDPESNVTLDTIVFERVLWALASAGNTLAASQACEVLTVMLDLHLSGRPHIEPSTHCFNACIQALVECRDEAHTVYAVELIKAIVEKYDNKNLAQLPSPAAFYKVIRSCRDAGSEEMVQQADAILKIAERLIRSSER
jgi:hypothetical protein